MKIEIVDVCTCGHVAGFHDSMIEEMTIPFGELFMPVNVVHQYQQCSWRDRDGYGHIVSADSTCECRVFKLDNLKYLENLS